MLVKGGSVFQSLKGRLTLDHRVLKLENAVADLERGRMTGRVTIDSRKDTPTLSTELRVRGASFDAFVGQPDMIRGPIDGLIRINGRGDTIRQAFASGNGKIAFVANGGAMNRAAAFVLGQDLGGAIGQKLGDDEKMVPIRCAIMAFSARGGVLVPAPFTIDTTISRGNGRGQINLDGETVALTLAGTAKKKASLRLVDPLRIDGTLTQPDIGFDQGSKTQGGDGKGLLSTIGRSIGTALGLRKDKDADGAGAIAAAIDCEKLSRAALN
ncbi:MAG TPA: AsmA-like C-terminal region-containing protein [Sphingopyxis sp.]|nr:AsmA-like C-terminal region-containing protein [Sphingopyxis sp.]